MAGSESGQDEVNHVFRLATRVARWVYLARLGFPLWCNKSFIDQACSVKMAGYWPHSLYALLWTSTSSRSINTQKRTRTPSLVNNAYSIRI